MSQEDEKYIDGTFQYIFGPQTQWDDLTPELFEFKISEFGRKVAAQGLGQDPPPPTSVDDYRKKSLAKRNEEKDDSQPFDYLQTTRVGL